MVRLRGIYAAEADEAGGSDATARAAAAFATAKTIILATTKTKAGRDVQTFARYVADIWVDGVSLAETLSVVPAAGVGASR